MSGDAENGKEDITNQFSATNVQKTLIANWQIGFKVIELILCAICTGFAYDPVNETGLVKKHLHHISIMYTAYTGYMLIIVVILVGRYLGDRLGYKTCTLFSAVGAVLFLTTGILLLADKAEQTKDYYFHPHRHLLTMLVTSLVFAFINAVVFAVDAVITFRRQEDF